MDLSAMGQVLGILEDETYRVLVACGTIIATCLVMIYRNMSRKELKEKPGLIRTMSEPVGDVAEGLLGAVDEVREFVAPRKTQRFRKRDRVWFYGRRWIRRVEENVKYAGDVGAKTQVNNFTDFTISYIEE